MPRRDVAVKVLPSDVRDPELRRMFNAEADVLAHLSRPSVDRHRLPGRHLGRRPAVHRHGVLPRLARAALPHRAACRCRRCSTIGVRMAGALESAHRRRSRPPRRQAEQHPGDDLRRPRARGLRHLVLAGAELAPTRCSRCRSRGARPRWSAEQTAGTVASEVWSLGATVYSLLAGHSPFERRERGQNTKELLRRRIARASYTAIPRTDVPASLQHVLARSMSRDPRERYASARAFAEALREVQVESGVAPTALEVPTAEWAAASAPVDFTRHRDARADPQHGAARRTPQGATRCRPSPDSSATRTPRSPR